MHEQNGYVNLHNKLHADRRLKACITQYHTTKWHQTSSHNGINIGDK